jgi:hypothetical protein
VTIVLLHRRGRWGALALLISLTVAVSLYLSASGGFRFFSALLATFYLVCIPLLRRVVMEYDPGSRMRYAWLLMLGTAWISVARHLLDFASSFFIADIARELRAVSLLTTDLSLVLQLLAFILLLSCFRQLGISRPFRWIDGVLVGLVTVLVVFCFSEARFFPHSASPEAFFRYIEFLNPVLFAATAVIGLLLYRLSMDIGSSDFSLSILFLMLQLFARFIGFSLQVLERQFASSDMARLSNIFYWTYPLLFLWAVLIRWQMIEGAAETSIVQDYARLNTPVSGNPSYPRIVSSSKSDSPSTHTAY